MTANSYSWAEGLSQGQRGWSLTLAFLKNLICVLLVLGATAGATLWNTARSEQEEETGEASGSHLTAESYVLLRKQVEIAAKEDRWADVIELGEQLITWTEDDDYVWRWLGLGYLRQGDYERAEQAWLIALRFPSFRVNTLYNLACSQSLLGKRDEALATFRELLDLGFTEFALVDRDEDFFALRGEPEFERMLDELAHRDVF